MRRFCIFGDSVGKGVIFDEDKNRYTVTHDSFCALLARQFGAEVDNYCKFGCTLGKGMEIVDRRMGELASFDAVLLEFGGNDSDFDWAAVAADPDGIHDCNTPMDKFINDYTALIGRVIDAGGKPMLVSVPAVDSDKYYKWISRSNDGEAIMRFLLEARRIEHWNEMYNNAVWSIASRMGVPVLDIRSPILFERGYKQLFCRDGIHLKPEAHKIIADSLAATLNKLSLRSAG